MFFVFYFCGTDNASLSEINGTV